MYLYTAVMFLPSIYPDHKSVIKSKEKFTVYGQLPLLVKGTNSTNEGLSHLLRKHTVFNVAILMSSSPLRHE